MHTLTILFSSLTTLIVVLLPYRCIIMITVSPEGPSPLGHSKSSTDCQLTSLAPDVACLGAHEQMRTRHLQGHGRLGAVSVMPW